MSTSKGFVLVIMIVTIYRHDYSSSIPNTVIGNILLVSDILTKNPKTNTYNQNHTERSIHYSDTDARIDKQY